MKTILMIMILGMLFISCSDGVITNPSVDAKKLEQLYTASDTVLYAVVTDEDYIRYYDISTPNRPVPKLTVIRDSPVQWLILGLGLLMGFGIGMAIGSSD